MIPSSVRHPPTDDVTSTRFEVGGVEELPRAGVVPDRIAFMLDQDAQGFTHCAIVVDNLGRSGRSAIRVDRQRPRFGLLGRGTPLGK